MKRGPRWMHRTYAALAGYFWLPCPTCGRHFGGHEWDLRNINGNRGVCSYECSDRARLRHSL